MKLNNLGLKTNILLIGLWLFCMFVGIYVHDTLKIMMLANIMIGFSFMIGLIIVFAE